MHSKLEFHETLTALLEVWLPLVAFNAEEASTLAYISHTRLLILDVVILK